MTILLIKNIYCYHLEIIESLIIKHKEIIKVDASEIYLSLAKPRGDDDKEYYHLIPPFVKYLKEKYPKIKHEVPKHYDYFINATLKNKYDILGKDKNTYFYISHRTCNFKDNENVFCLTPLSKRYIYADILPFADTMNLNKSIPIFIIQGAKRPSKRNFKLLDNIISKSYKYKFKIKWAGNGKLPQKYEKCVESLGGDFYQYHKHFLDCYCIIPLITKGKNPDYYCKKLTSSINYAKGYKLKCLIDKDLQDIYNLPDVEIFNNENDIHISFEKVLIKFYNTYRNN